MSGDVVVFSHLPGEQPFTSQRHQVVPVECRDDHDYWRGLSIAWATADTVVNVEHDIQVDDSIIETLLDCPQPLCAQTYPIYYTDGSVAFPYCAPERPDTWVREGAEWAVWAAPGFIKARRDARLSPLPERHWLEVEQATNEAVNGPWHLHWPPVQHRSDFLR